MPAPEYRVVQVRNGGSYGVARRLSDADRVAAALTNEQLRQPPLVAAGLYFDEACRLAKALNKKHDDEQRS